MDIYKISDYWDNKNKEIIQDLEKEGLEHSVISFLPEWENEREEHCRNLDGLKRLTLKIEFIKKD